MIFWGPPAVSELGFHELGISHPWFMPGFFRWRCRVVRQLLACGFWGLTKEDWLREKEGFFSSSMLKKCLFIWSFQGHWIWKPPQFLQSCLLSGIANRWTCYLSLHKNWNSCVFPFEKRFLLGLVMSSGGLSKLLVEMTGTGLTLFVCSMWRLPKSAHPDVDVSKNRGILPPKWMVKISWKPLLKWMIWGVFPYFWKRPCKRRGYV